MRRGLGGALLLTAALGLSLLTGPASAVAPVLVEPASQVEPAFKRDFLPPCASPTSMNCIESIEYLVDGQWRMAVLIPHDGPDTPYTYGYATPGLEHEGGRTAVNAGLIERDDINGPPYAAYQFQLQAHPHGTDVFWDPPINLCKDGNPATPGTGPCWRAPWLADTEYRFTFRTNTLVPIFARSSAMGLTATEERIPGGRRVSVTGRPGPWQHWPDEETDSFRGLTYEWEGFIADARAKGGSIAACQGLGIATAYSNGHGGFMPEWNAQTGTLVFGITGQHYGPDGSVYGGEALVLVPGPLARCMWKIDPRQVSRMEVEVFTENGEESVGTKSVAYDDVADLVRIVATNFTYSQKDIVARPKPVAATPGKKSCNAAKTVCVTVDKKRSAAKVTLSKAAGTQDVVAVALRGTREDGRTQVSAPVRSGKASVTLRLGGNTSKGQVWVLRSQSSFISSFQVG